MTVSYTRRDLLKLLAASPALTLAARGAELDFRTPAKPSGSGPRLFFSAEDLPRLRRNFSKNARFKELRDTLLGRDRDAERAYLRSDVNLFGHRSDIRRVGEMAQEMSFLYLMTGDQDAAALSVECVRTLMRFPYWDFFLEGGEHVVGVQRAPACAIAVSCSIDWLGDYVTSAERQSWLTVLGKRGCEPCYVGLNNVRHPRETIGWSINPESDYYSERSEFPNDSTRRPEITQKINLRAAPAGGLAIGAAAIGAWGEENSEMERWLEMAIFSLKIFEEVYLPDGSYGEGIHYANYTSECIFMAFEALKQTGVMDLDSSINWSGNVQFMLNMSMPTKGKPYEVVNIGDNGRYRDAARSTRSEYRSALPYWTARKFGDGAAQWFGDHLGAEHSLWSLIFFDETVTAIAPTEAVKVWYSDLDWVVARSGFEADDLVVSLRSGGGYNHEHADRNSMIIKCYGEQLIVDPIRPPYAYADPSWMMRTTAGHSAILIDGEGHLYHNGVEGTNATIALARVVDKGAGKGYAYFTSDATHAYRVANVEVQSVVRSVVVFFDVPAVVVIDRVSKFDRPSKIEARYFGDNWDGKCQLSTESAGFAIRRPDAFAQARTFSRNAISVETDRLPIPEERAVKHPFVSVKTEATMATTIVTAFGLGRRGDTAPKISFTSSVDAIDVVLKTSAASVDCRIEDTNRVPRIQVNV